MTPLFDGGVYLHSAFEIHAQRSPDAVAVVAEDGSPTYGELSARANRLARWLIAADVGPGDRVAVVMRPGAEMTAAMLAVSAAGAAWAAADCYGLDDRIDFFVADVAPSIVLTDQRLALHAVKLGRTRAVRTGELDLGAFPSGPVRDEERVAPLRGGHPACVVRNHRHAGSPVLVGASHRAAAGQLAWLAARCDLGPDDVYAQRHRFLLEHGFPWGLWLQLSVGGRAVVCDLDRPERLAETVRRHQVTVVDLAVPWLADFVPAAARCPSLRHVLAVGPVPTQVVSAWEGASAAVLHDLLTVDSLGYPVADGGEPAPGVHAHLLDDHLEAVPPGQVGVLYLSGEALGFDYLERPEVAATHLVAAPAGGRMVCTDYFARRGQDGRVAVTGYRRVLGALRYGQFWRWVEEVVRAHNSVGSLHLGLYWPDAGQPVLAAYVEPADRRAADREEITAFVAERLPSMLVPQVAVLPDGLPVGVNGMIDRRALPDPRVGG